MTARAVVLSPHLDDAVLSCWSVVGGVGDVIVVNVFAGVPARRTVGSWDGRTGAVDSQRRARERIAEDRVALRLTGREPVNLDFLEAQYRTGDGPLEPLVQALTPYLSDAEVVYAPAGIGAHPDHLLVRDVALAVRPDARLYADLPYAMQSGWKAPTHRVERRIGVDGRKQEALALYATQLGPIEREWGRLPDWELFWETAPHPFAVPEWARVWAETFDVPLLDAPAPLWLDGEVLRFAGAHGDLDLTDYMGPAVRETACALRSWLDDTRVPWRRLEGRSMLPDVADAVADAVVTRGESTAPLALPPTWDEYLASLSRDVRHELRRKRRRLAGAVVCDGDLTTFVRQHRLSSGRKGAFMQPRVVAFFERIADLFAKRGELRLDALVVAGRPLAVCFGFEVAGTYFLYNAAYDPAVRGTSPGIVLVSKVIERSIERGLVRFDFLRGAERYKLRFGATPYPLVDLTLVRA